MALLPGVLNQSFYEDIRDKIAQILVLEIPAQGVLLEDSAIAGIDKVYVERSIAFSEETLPALNVVFEKIDFENETSVDVNFSAEYSVQVYGSVKSTATQRGDEKSSKFVQKLAALVQGILSYGAYNRLGFDVPSANDPNGVSNRKVQGIQFFNPESSGNSEMIVRAMVRVKVTGSQSKLAVTPRALEGSDTQMVLFNSNEAYFYATDNPILPPPNTGPCEPVIVRNSDGSWMVTQLAGTTLVVSDSIVEVNGNAEGLIKAVKPIDVKVINSSGPVGIVSVDVDDNEVTIELSSSCADGEVTLDGVPLVTVSSGGAEDVQLVNQVGATITPLSVSGGVIKVDMTFPCSGIGGYKGSQPYYTLPSNNVCGHAFRLCGRTGGYYSGTGYFDKNGVATTKALAFPDGIIYDTYGVTCNGDLLVFQDQFLLTGLVTLANAIAFCDSFSLGGFSDWIQMERDHYDQIRNNDTQYVLDHPPFSNPYSAVELWTNTTFPFSGTTTRAWKLNIYGGEEFAFKTSEAARAFPVRIGNESEIEI